MWGDRDPPAFIDAHALKTAVHPCDESAQADLADEGFASVMTVESEGEVGESVSSKIGRNVQREDCLKCVPEARVMVP